MMKEYRVTHKRLGFIRVFLIYVYRNYKCMMPYFKGLNLKIDSWQEGRDKDLYKTKSQLRVRLKVWE